MSQTPRTLVLVIKVRMGNAPVKRNDKTFVPLQAADMLAGYVQKHYVDRILNKISGSIPENPMLINFKEGYCDPSYIQSRFDRFIRANPKGFEYETGKARSARLAKEP